MNWFFLSIAIDDDGELTDPLGLRMAELPVNPMLAKMLLTSGLYSNIKISNSKKK